MTIWSSCFSYFKIFNPRQGANRNDSLPERFRVKVFSAQCSKELTIIDGFVGINVMKILFVCHARKANTDISIRRGVWKWHGILSAITGLGVLTCCWERVIRLRLAKKESEKGFCAFDKAPK